MASSKFPILRGLDALVSRLQDNIAAFVEPTVTTLGATPIMGAAAPSWIAPSPLNGWTNNGGGYATLGYHRDALGYVHFRGLVVAGTLNTEAFTLPLGYRPKLRLTFACYASPGGAQADVRQDGLVVLFCPAGTTSVALEVISFLAEA